MPQKLAEKVRWGIYRTQIQPREHDIVAMSGQRSDIATFDWLIANLGRVMPAK